MPPLDYASIPPVLTLAGLCLQPYAECSECKAPSGEYGCNTLQRVTFKNRVAGLCCECVRKNGSKVTGHQFNWTSDSCKPCRDRKFAKCGGVFQKRTLSSSCVCGLSLAEHNITAHLHQNAAKPPSHTGADERDTQPSVPPGAQGAWDIVPSSQPDRRENGEWQKFTDVPDSSFKYDDVPINMQVQKNPSPLCNASLHTLTASLTTCSSA